MSLAHKSHWIFDLDGTLTVAQHDFAAIRRQLEFPENKPILEHLEQLPPLQQEHKRKQLDKLEADLAEQAQAAEGAEELLARLKGKGASLGIVTRNSTINALAGLSSAGLADYFHPFAIIAREQAQPKPSPAGILKLISGWQAHSDKTVMVGDYMYDLSAGRQAEVYTIHVAVDGNFAWPQLTDLAVASLTELLFTFNKSTQTATSSL